MIKYLELTAPEKSEFRQAKILSIEVAEGDAVSKGDTLFKVMSGNNEIDLPCSMDGKIVEIIAIQDENISVLTPLVLLETEVEGSTASEPIIESEDSKPTAKSDSNKKPTKKKKPKKKTKSKKKAHKQQSLNLDLEHDDEANDEPEDEIDIEQTAVSKTIENNNMSTLQIKVPDIGADNAKVIELLVKVGDKIEADDPLVTLESDKASMDVPSTASGVVTSISVSLEDNVSEGTLILELSSESNGVTAAGDESKPSEEDESETNAAAAESITTILTTTTTEVAVPDIGGDSAKVIEILVEVGQTIAIEDPLVTLESDKASMDVPSTSDGVIKSIEVEVDQDVSEGVIVILLESNESSNQNESEVTDRAESVTDSQPARIDTIVEVVIPDIGGDAAKVIEILVSEGQEIKVEDPLVTLESDKASMDVPSSATGTIQSIELELDQEVSEGIVVAKILSTVQSQPTEAKTESASISSKSSTPSSAATSVAPVLTAPAGNAHASPSIRRFARELGVDLSKIGGSGRKGRIVKDDVKAFVKNIMLSGGDAPGAPASGSGIPPIPEIDFTKFGEIDTQPLNKIKKLTAKNLHRAWLNIPHVTHNDESNISDLEVFRKQLNQEYAAQDKGIKLSPLAFIVKAVVRALRAYPQFNSSLSPDGESIIYKQYYHIGIAVETPNGLVVPVIRDADKKSVSDIALAMGELAGKARDKKLSPADMSGASFTISSLGGIGGTSFTPIVNAPEVAILGVSRNKIQPVWDGEKFEPGTILPLSLSYDHRIIDGAEAARFTAHIAAALEDVRRLTV